MASHKKLIARLVQLTLAAAANGLALVAGFTAVATLHTDQRCVTSTKTRGLKTAIHTHVVVQPKHHTHTAEGEVKSPGVVFT